MVSKCQAKQADQAAGRLKNQRPRKDFQAHAAVAQDAYEGEPSEEHPVQVGALYYAPQTLSMIPHPPFDQEDQEGKDF